MEGIKNQEDVFLNGSILTPRKEGEERGWPGIPGVEEEKGGSLGDPWVKEEKSGLWVPGGNGGGDRNLLMPEGIGDEEILEKGDREKEVQGIISNLREKIATLLKFLRIKKDSDERKKEGEKVSEGNLEGGERGDGKERMIKLLTALFWGTYAIQALGGVDRYSMGGYAVHDFLGGDMKKISELMMVLGGTWLGAKPLLGLGLEKLGSNHYREWLASSFLLASLGWCAAGFSKLPLIPSLAMAQVGFAAADVAIDGLVVKKARTKDELASYQAACRSGKYWGMFLGLLSGGYLISHLPPDANFALVGSLPFVVGSGILAAGLSKRGKEIFEPESDLLKSEQIGGKSFDQVYSSKTLLALTALILFLWSAAPEPGSALRNFIKGDLNLSPQTLGLDTRSFLEVMLFAGLGAGTSAYAWLRKKAKVNLETMLKVAPPLGALSTAYLLSLGGAQGDPALASAITATHGLSYALAITPLFELASRVTPKKWAAPVFASLMSVMGLGNIAGEWGAKVLQEFLPLVKSQAAVFAALTPLGFLISKKLKKAGERKKENS